MSHYARGRRYEYKAKERLEAMGYACTRSASSKGLWDVTAVAPGVVCLVQVKSQNPGAKSSYKDKNFRLFEKLPVPNSVTKEVWVYTVGVGAPEIIQL